MTTAPAASGEAEDYLTRCAETLTRSEIVAWLLRHYEKLEAATVRRTLRWDELALRLNRAGLRNIHGQETNGGSLRVTWYRVRKLVAAERLQAEAEEASKERARLEAEAQKAALREAARAEVARKSGEDAKLKERMAAAERVAVWEREQQARRREDEVRAAARRAERTAERMAVVTGTAVEKVSVEVASEGGVSHLVTLDLPQVEDVSYRAYLPFDPTLPPVRKGDRIPKTGHAWQVGDDLPGYPSKRNYDYENDWLRDVGLLLRAKHPTNLTMTFDEQDVIWAAQSRVPQFFR